MNLIRFAALTFIYLSFSTVVEAAIRLEQFEYPFPVKSERIFSQQQELDMSFMELPAQKKHLGTVVLLSDSEFCAAYWKETAEALSKAGYEVIMPDQLGLGKSFKPNNYQYSLQQMVENARSLLLRKRLWKTHLVGHGMGGMLAVRYALMFPKEILSVTLVNPRGLEDGKAQGQAYVSVDTRYQNELKETAEQRRNWQREHYYGGEWKTSYERWIQMFEHLRDSPDYFLVAWNQSLIQDMVYTQPVCYEFSRLEVPVLLLLGKASPWSSEKNEETPLPLNPEAGKLASTAIPKVKLIELENAGYLPHLDSFPEFIELLLPFLKKPTWDKKR